MTNSIRLPRQRPQLYFETYFLSYLSTSPTMQEAMEDTHTTTTRGPLVEFEVAFRCQTRGCRNWAVSGSNHCTQREYSSRTVIQYLLTLFRCWSKKEIRCCQVSGLKHGCGDKRTQTVVKRNLLLRSIRSQVCLWYQRTCKARKAHKPDA